MTVQQLIDRLNRNRVELDDFCKDICCDLRINDIEFDSVLDQVLIARRTLEFSLRFLQRLHPDMIFSFNEAIKKPKAELIMLCGERGAYASGQRSGAPERTCKASEVH
ncbi:MAG: hypothetical protein PHD01_18170 [Geobacteraceae bacterium]|nr:hypothetical protein [Geobacteraceae bacterium]